MKHIISIFTSVAVLALLVAPSSVLATDEEAPDIGPITPLTAHYDVSKLFYATASDPSGVSSCTLVVSTIYDTPMTYNASAGWWETEYTFTTRRTANSIRMRCMDGAGNEALGPARLITVTEVPTEDTEGEGDTSGGDDGDGEGDSSGGGDDTSGEGDDGESEVDATEWDRDAVIEASPVLIKTPCPGGEDFTHPCRTVYFLDVHGVRHAFPNEKIYFTWYERFDDIHVITEEHMASFTLGRNVRYHPGKRLVKFPSINTVYAVSRHGLLRRIASEAVAHDLYGATWNQQIDDLSEAFFSNYRFGEAINHAIDWDRDAQRGSVTSINDNIGE